MRQYLHNLKELLQMAAQLAIVLGMTLFIGWPILVTLWLSSELGYPPAGCIALATASFFLWFPFAATVLRLK